MTGSLGKSMFDFSQDKFDHDKGQKSAISGRRLHWRLSTGFFAFFSCIYVQFSQTSPTESGESSEKSSGENRVKSCHVCGCRGFFGPEVTCLNLTSPSSVFRFSVARRSGSKVRADSQAAIWAPKRSNINLSTQKVQDWTSKVNLNLKTIYRGVPSDGLRRCGMSILKT